MTQQNVIEVKDTDAFSDWLRDNGFSLLDADVLNFGHSIDSNPRASELWLTNGVLEIKMMRQGDTITVCNFRQVVGPQWDSVLDFFNKQAT